MKRTKTLSYKLSLIFFSGLVFAMTASGVTTFLVQNKIVKNLTNSTLKNAVFASSRETEEELIAAEATLNDSKYMVQSYFNSATSLEDSVYVHNSLEEIHKLYKGATENFDCTCAYYVFLNPLYTHLSKESPQGDGFFWVKDSDGVFKSHEVTNILQYDENDTEHVGWWYSIAKTVSASWVEPYYNANVDKNMFSYVTPFFSNNDEFLGILGIDFSFESFLDHLSEIKDYSNAYPYLQNSKGTIVYHKDIETIKDGRYVGSSLSLEDISGVENFQESADGAITYRYGGERRTTMCMTLANDLIYGISVKTGELRKPIRMVTFIPVLVFIGISLLLVGLFYILSHRYIRPIEELHKAVERVQQGDYKLKIDAKRDDEIGDLAKSFSEMLSSLQEKNRMITAMAFIDGLTGVKNKNAQRDMVKRIDEDIKQGKAQFAVVMLDVDKLKMINDTLGHEEGDKVIIGSCYSLCKAFSHSKVYRIGGDEFVAIAEGEDYENRQEIFTKLLKNEISVRNQKFEFSVGMATYNPGSDKSFKDVFERADQEMYLNKKAKKKYE